MHVITRRRLVEFWEVHPEAQQALDGWYTYVKKARWSSIVDVRKDYPHADPVDTFTIFNVCGNKYRLVTAIHYNRQKVYIRHVMTHAEYDKGKWRTP